MKNTMKKIAVLLAVCGLMGAAPLAYAMFEGGPEGGPEAGPGGLRKGGGPAFFKELNLTDEQKAKLRAHRESQMEKNKGIREQLRTKMQSLHEQIGQPVTDKAKISAQVAEINALKGQLFSQHIEGVLAMKEILTPEQFAKMQAKHKERFEQKQNAWKPHREEAVEERE
jgi:Spy/CpxP family protein refolding chaperone